MPRAMVLSALAIALSTSVTFAIGRRSTTMWNSLLNPRLLWTAQTDRASGLS